MADDEAIAPRKVLRRLVLCLDGTWNTDDAQTITNIVEIRNRVLPNDEDGVEQRVYYDWGVGTGLGLDRLTGGAFGDGMEDKVRAAYRFLSANFVEDDTGGTEIYIFGFSRGAYTARALAGFVGAAGLLRPENCTAELENRVWRYYRTPPKRRLPADRIAFTPLVFPKVRIRCLGVFDTVGALGIPVHWFSRLNRLRYDFHDTELGSNVEVALQALALDEKRYAFQPAVWSKPQHTANRIVEQVWFPGVHSNVGGGYDDNRLSLIALHWMLSRIETFGLGLAVEMPQPGDGIDHLAEGRIYESRTGILYLPDIIRPAFRKVANLAPVKGRYRPVGLLPHGIVFREYVHWTCLYRRQILRNRGADERYAPANLELAIARVRAAYAPAEAPPPPGPPLLVVGIDGDILQPDSPAARAQVAGWLDDAAVPA